MSVRRNPAESDPQPENARASKPKKKMGFLKKTVLSLTLAFSSVAGIGCSTLGHAAPNPLSPRGRRTHRGHFLEPDPCHDRHPAGNAGSGAGS